MFKLINIAGVIALIISFGSCEKNQLKKPTEARFKFDVNNNYAQNLDLMFENGHITISEFKVEGEREVGSDISFKREFLNELSFDLNGSNEIEELDYDIPQGDYNAMEVSFETPDDADEVVFYLEGFYTTTSGFTVPVRFETKEEIEFEIAGQNENGSNIIELDKKKVEKVEIQFNPVAWFAEVPASTLDNADMVAVDENLTILINETYNVDVYEIVMDDISESNTAIFK